MEKIFDIAKDKEQSWGTLATAIDGNIEGLEQEVGELDGQINGEGGDIDLTKIPTISGIINAQSYKWELVTNLYYRHKAVEVSEGETYHIVANDTKAIEYYQTSEYNVADGEDAKVIERDSVAANTEKDVVIKAGVKYIILIVEKGNGNDCTPASMSKAKEKGLVDNVNELQSIVSETTDKLVPILGTNEDIDIDKLEMKNGFPLNDTWTVSSSYGHFVFENPNGKKFTIKANADYANRYWLLNQYNVAVGQPLTKLFSGIIAANETQDIEINNDEYNYLVVESKYENVNRKPQSILVTKDGITERICDLEKSLCNPISKLYPNEKLPVISFEFDDNSPKDDMVVELFDRYKSKANFAFIASNENIDMFGEKYLKYQKRGYGICSHSIDGNEFNTNNYPTESSALNVFMTSKEKLENFGFVVNGFVSPGSTMEASYMPTIRKVYAYAFTRGDENSRQSNPCAITRYSLQANSVDQIKSFIDECIQGDKICTLYAHSNDFGKLNTTCNEIWSVEKLEEILNYVISKKNEGSVYFGNTDDCVKYYFDL